MTLYRRPPRCYQRHLPNRCDRHAAHSRCGYGGCGTVTCPRAEARWRLNGALHDIRMARVNFAVESILRRSIFDTDRMTPREMSEVR